MTQIKVTLGPVTAGAAMKLAESRGITVPALVHELIRAEALVAFAQYGAKAAPAAAKPTADSGR